MSRSSNLREPQYQNVITGYQRFESRDPFTCEHGGVLSQFTIAYETWGELDEARDNVILVHTGLSASSHAHSQEHNLDPGWWEAMIGPGAALDTDRYFVVCTNVLGGCYGSTGPSSINPQTEAPYATDFPIITIRDMVRAQLLLLDHLGIPCLHASVGASMGGMQSLALATLAPERVARVVSISAAARSYPETIALRYVQRRAIMSDPDWNDGFYYGRSFPYRGQSVARALGTLTYRSSTEWRERFGRDRGDNDTPRLDEDFEIERYLAHQAEKFCLQYDANSYLYLSKAMDLFDLVTSDANSTSAPIERLFGPTLIIGATTDALFPLWQQQELRDLIVQRAPAAELVYEELETPYGHDAFLLERRRLGALVRAFLDPSWSIKPTLGGPAQGLRSG